MKTPPAQQNLSRRYGYKAYTPFAIKIRFIRFSPLDSSLSMEAIHSIQSYLTIQVHKYLLYLIHPHGSEARFGGMVCN